MSEIAPASLTHKVIGCAIEVHRELGPGLLESAYEQCLAHELSRNDIPFIMEAAMPIEYRGIKIDCAYRLDFIVDAQLVLELKAVQQIDPIHEVQLLTYLKLSKLRTGLIINFNECVLKNGIRRFVL